MASASPSASCISEEVVGARLCGQASRACGSASTTSAVVGQRRVRVGGHRDQADAEAARIIGEILQLRRLARPRQRDDHVVARRSCRDRRGSPRSGARTAPACRSRRRSRRSCAPTWPDLPMPVTMTRPCAARISSIAAAKLAPSPSRSAVASASMPPPSASSVRSAEFDRRLRVRSLLDVGWFKSGHIKFGPCSFAVLIARIEPRVRFAASQTLMPRLCRISGFCEAPSARRASTVSTATSAVRRWRPQRCPRCARVRAPPHRRAARGWRRWD